MVNGRLYLWVWMFIIYCLQDFGFWNNMNESNYVIEI